MLCKDRHGQETWRKSPFMQGQSIVPIIKIPRTLTDLVEAYEGTCFEARNVAAGAKLFKRMIEGGDTIWLGVAGAGPVGGMGGYIIELIKAGFVDVICTTGAQAYHDAHFAWTLPVVQGTPNADNNAMDADGTTRIYDINIRLDETLKKQDDLFKAFARTLPPQKRSTADFNHAWGEYVRAHAPHPERSWMATAAQYEVPVFFDSESNHSIGMNNAALFLEGIDTMVDPSLSLLEGAGFVYGSPQLGFFEWGGGGPKNWIQTLAPMISQILDVKFEGADRGLQITTASERDGGLSGCTFGEAVTWGKYEEDDPRRLVQIWGEYSVIVPIIVGYVFEQCASREPRRLFDRKKVCYERLVDAAKKE